MASPVRRSACDAMMRASRVRQRAYRTLPRGAAWRRLMLRHGVAQRDGACASNARALVSPDTVLDVQRIERFADARVQPVLAQKVAEGLGGGGKPVRHLQRGAI
jgi:hypothetical protein